MGPLAPFEAKPTRTAQPWTFLQDASKRRKVMRYFRPGIQSKRFKECELEKEIMPANEKETIPVNTEETMSVNGKEINEKFFSFQSTTFAHIVIQSINRNLPLLSIHFVRVCIYLATGRVPYTGYRGKILNVTTKSLVTGQVGTLN
jgi:hypothetical protein